MWFWQPPQQQEGPAPEIPPANGDSPQSQPKSSPSLGRALSGILNAFTPKIDSPYTDENPAPKLGRVVDKNPLWTDYEIEGATDRVARVYAQSSAKRLARELEALDSIHASAEELGLSHALWAPRILDRRGVDPSLLVVLERPLSSLTLWDSRALLTRGQMAMLWLQVGRCIERLEQSGWLHTALWPGSVLVIDRPLVMLCDWGFATRKPGRHLTRSDFGPWVPPELANGDVTRGSDIYSWVAILYWILMGVPPATPREPFSGEEGAEELEKTVFAQALEPDYQLRCTDRRTIANAALKWIEKYCPAEK